MKTLFTRLFGGIKGLLFILAVGVGLLLHFYVQHIIGGLRAEARSFVQYYAGLYSKIVETDSEDLTFLFDQFILKTNFPLIQTDAEKNPISWKGIEVDPDDRSEAALERVARLVEQMDREIEPVPILYEDTVLSYLFYGDSRLVQQLRWLPYIEVGILGMFILVGFVGYAHIKRSEQRTIWVGMAKETAHQLGTPISSLMGWLEIMRSGKRTKKDEVYGEMEKDLRRLQGVTTRFSKIGSKPDLKESDVAGVLREVVEYIRRRAPQRGRRVDVFEEYAEVSRVPLNAGLFQWAVENVMKNSLDAMDKEKGEIRVRLGPLERGSGVFVELEDNGRGLDTSQRRRIFKPGYSTKKRGWGLGLTLSRRIVEEYHGGRIFVKESKPGRGTIIRMEI